jgi:hypothetical protein
MDMGFLNTAPMRFLLLVTGAWLVIFLLTRSVLLITHLDEVGGNLLPVFGVGLLYDLAFLAYAALPLGLYLLLCPPALWRRRPAGGADRQPVRHAVYVSGRVAVLG